MIMDGAQRLSLVLCFGALASCSGDQDVLGPPVRPETRRFPLGELVTAEHAPPAIQGGTLLALQDARTVVVSDVDRDRVLFVDVVAGSITATVTLAQGAEPGRLAEGANGNVWVVLRGTGVLALVHSDGTVTPSLQVCAAPQGVAFDAVEGVAYVACETGELVTATAEGVVDSVFVERDLRDVVLGEGELFVSLFRSAEVLRLTRSGDVTEHIKIADAFGRESAVAWRMVGGTNGDLIVLHQRARNAAVAVDQNSYGGDCGIPIVGPGVTMIQTDGMQRGGQLQAVLAMDVATAPTGTLAIGAAGARTEFGDAYALTIGTEDFEQVDPNVPVPSRETVGDESPFGPFGCSPLHGNPQPFATDREGQVVAVAYSGSRLVLQSREPAALWTDDGAVIELGGDSVRDTGHDLFHLNGGVGLACASCHPGGREDSVTWTFNGEGQRRTQDLRGGVLASAPFHWDGSLANFEALADEVLAQRMGGPDLPADYLSALGAWVDSIPAAREAPIRDEEAVERGDVLFHSSALGCTGCHAGERYQRDGLFDVGTGLALQVPSLRGVSSRAPFLHNGCAPTLLDRFGSCGGGDHHGQTSQLDDASLRDLVAYLESI